METLFSPSLYHHNRGYLPIDGLEPESQKIASCSRISDHFIRSHQTSAKVTPPRHQELMDCLKTGAFVVDFLASPLAGMAVFAAISGCEEYFRQSGDPSCPINWEKLAKTIVWGMTADMAGLAALAMLGKTGKTVHTLEDLAATCPVVQRGLMKLSHATYFMRMKNALNPHSRDLEVAYSCMGADVSTVLMATNARRVAGIDLHTINPDFLRHYMSKTGEELLSDDYSPRHSPIDPDYLRHLFIKMRREVMKRAQMRDGNYFDSYDYSGFSPRDYQKSILDNVIGIRQGSGYWHDYYIRTDHIDPERLIAIELDRLDVNRQEAKVFTEGPWTVLEFDWAYPGELAKPRRVQWIEGNAEEFLDKPTTTLGDFFDGYFQKGSKDFTVLHDHPERIKPVAERINKGGFIAVGNSIEQKIFDVNQAVRTIGDKWQSIQPPLPTDSNPRDYNVLSILRKA